jgi:hypothetical protein
MPSARELLEQADALMRRNRARAVDTEIPELTEVVAEVAPAPGATLIALEDVPELVDLVEEIEIASIVELPDDLDEVSGWLSHEPGDLGDGGGSPDSAVAGLPMAKASEAGAGSVRSLHSVVGKPGVATDPMPAVGPSRPATEVAPPAAEPTPVAAETAPPAVGTTPPAAGSTTPERAVVAEISPALPVPIADDWARWEALAEEIRMQVLQRIDIFTDTRLRKQLSAQLQPIVDRAGVQMVETINEEVGRLLRAYIAEAIEREIDKWRGTGG